MSAWYAVVLLAAVASGTLGSESVFPSHEPTLTPTECATTHRACACGWIEALGRRCRGFVPRTASEEPPKFPDEERSKPIPVDPSEVVPIQ